MPSMRILWLAFSTVLSWACVATDLAEPPSVSRSINGITYRAADEATVLEAAPEFARIRDRVGRFLGAQAPEVAEVWIVEGLGDTEHGSVDHEAALIVVDADPRFRSVAMAHELAHTVLYEKQAWLLPQAIVEGMCHFTAVECAEPKPSWLQADLLLTAATVLGGMSADVTFERPMGTVSGSIQVRGTPPADLERLLQASATELEQMSADDRTDVVAVGFALATTAGVQALLALVREAGAGDQHVPVERVIDIAAGGIQLAWMEALADVPVEALAMALRAHLADAVRAEQRARPDLRGLSGLELLSAVRGTFHHPCGGSIDLADVGGIADALPVASDD